MALEAKVEDEMKEIELTEDEWEKIPSRYICPITQDIMTDPVMIADGTNCERKAIQQWFDNGNRTSPLKGPLPNLHLSPNWALKNEINEWIQSREQQQGLMQQEQEVFADYQYCLEIMQRDLKEAQSDKNKTSSSKILKTSEAATNGNYECDAQITDFIMSLKHIDHKKYLKILKKNGVFNMYILQTLTDNDMVLMIAEIGSRRLIINALEQLKHEIVGSKKNDDPKKHNDDNDDEKKHHHT